MHCAIVKISGRQHMLVSGKTSVVNKLIHEPGEEITLEQVLWAKGEDGKVLIGKPVLNQVQVTAEVVEHIKAKRVVHFHMRRRKNSKRTRGHVQEYTKLAIKSISEGAK